MNILAVATTEHGGRPKQQVLSEIIVTPNLSSGAMRNAPNVSNEGMSLCNHVIGIQVQLQTLRGNVQLQTLEAMSGYSPWGRHIGPAINAGAMSSFKRWGQCPVLTSGVGIGVQL